jgi:hypothetical protein
MIGSNKRPKNRNRIATIGLIQIIGSNKPKYNENG